MTLKRFNALIVYAPLFVSACHRTAATEPSALDQPPSGEVWVTPEEFNSALLKVDPIAEHEIDNSIFTSGKVTFDDQRVALVYSPVTGRVVHIDAMLGQRVKKGDALATIQSPDLGQASSDLGKADADVLASQHSYTRKKELYDQHAASAADVEAAEDTYRRAKAERERAYQKSFLLRGGGADVTQGYRLTSPIEGEVIARSVNPGIEVQGQYGGGTAVALFTVGELDSVWVLADVFEMDLPRVKISSHVAVTVIAYPDRVFNGTVDWISGTLDPNTRTARVRCTFANADRALHPGMYATVLITIDQQPTLAIPRKAIVRSGAQTIVFVEKDDLPDGRHRFQKVAVKPSDRQGGDWIPMPPPLQKGTRVVTNNAIILLGML